MFARVTLLIAAVIVAFAALLMLLKLLVVAAVVAALVIGAAVTLRVLRKRLGRARLDGAPHVITLTARR